MTATYRLLSDVVVNGAVIHAGTTITMPDEWAPPSAVDPLDSNAIANFWNAGPVPVPSVRQQ
jgi:hypothetical protein